MFDMERKKTNTYHKSSSTSTHHLLHNPSFSSSLLDSIYRSIDEEHVGCKDVPDEMVSYQDLARAARRNRKAGGVAFRGHGEQGEAEAMKVDHDDLGSVEKWVMDMRRSSEKAARKSSSAVLSNSSSSSSSSSSESSFWSGGLSSSESEYSFYGPKSISSSSSSCYSATQRPKPIRTERNAKSSSSQKTTKHHDHEEILAKTKSKALRIYAELKKAKVKQPISPGAKLASFLNSLFVNTKRKPKTVSEPYGRASDESARVKYSKSKSGPTYDCPSSASSCSRSCLSKTPSSGGKPSTNNGAKRSVRFDPVSVIVGEDSQPCGHKNLQEEDSLKVHVMEENRRVAEAARKLLGSYQRTKVSYDPENCDDGDGDLMEDDIDDDGVSSCSSSDLFELNNLSAIGIERYREELPVYETTHVGTNRAIAHGLFL